MSKRSCIAIAVGLLLATTACGRAGSGAVDGDVVTIHGVDVPLSFEPSEIELDAGTYTIDFRNDGMLPHQLALGEAKDDGDFPDGDSAQVAGGDHRMISVTLEPGRHTFACYVDRHNDAGMTGTLIVH